MDVEQRSLASLAADLWGKVLGFAQSHELSQISCCSKLLRDVCISEQSVRLAKGQNLKVVDPSLFRSWIPQYRGGEVVPCLFVALSGEISARVLCGGNLEQCARTSLLATVSNDHQLETVIEPGQLPRMRLLRKSGLCMYQVPSSNEGLKRIELRWRGVFKGKARYFGIPLVLFVQRVVDRHFIHVEVRRRIQPFLQDRDAPQYDLRAFSRNVEDGSVCEVPFTSDYMIVDTQMHPTNAQLILIVEFLQDVASLQMPGVSGLDQVPPKLQKVVASLVEREVGVRFE